MLKACQKWQGTFARLKNGYRDRTSETCLSTRPPQDQLPSADCQAVISITTVLSEEGSLPTTSEGDNINDPLQAISGGRYQAEINSKAQVCHPDDWP